MTNVWCVKNILANCDGNLCLPILHLPRVELHCKLQEKLHRVTGPYDALFLCWNILFLLSGSKFCLHGNCLLLSSLEGPNSEI